MCIDLDKLLFIILKTAVKENEIGADARKHLRILKFLARNPGALRVSIKKFKSQRDFA